VKLRNSEIYLWSSEENSFSISLVEQKLWDSVTNNSVVIIILLSISLLESDSDYINIDKLNLEKASFRISDVMREEIEVYIVSDFTWLERSVILVLLLI
jgi:hypothetical protein